jgi:hypothetical protein
MELYEFYSDTGLSREDINWLFKPTTKESFGILDKAKDAIVNKALKPVSDFTKNSTNALTNVFANVVNQIKSAAINMSTTIASATKKIPKSVQVAINNITNSTKNMFAQVNKSRLVVQNSIKSAGNTVKKSLTNTSNKIVNSTKKSMNDVKKYSKSLVNGIMRVVKPVINFIINTAKNFSQNIKWLVLLLGVILICFTFGRIKSFFKWIL